MHSPSHDHLAGARHVVMHLVAVPDHAWYGGFPGGDLQQPDVLIPPYTKGHKALYYHFFSDASNAAKSISGGVGMLGGGPIQHPSSRQHLTAPESHTAEVVSGGTNVNHVIPVNGVLQELSIRLGMATPYYLDSRSTTFVASTDIAVRKSVWLQRRADVLQEAVEYHEIRPIHISEADMVADHFTKYLPTSVYVRHKHYLLNLPGDPPGVLHEYDSAAETPTIGDKALPLSPTDVTDAAASHQVSRAGWSPADVAAGFKVPAAVAASRSLLPAVAASSPASPSPVIDSGAAASIVDLDVADGYLQAAMRSRGSLTVRAPTSFGRGGGVRGGKGVGKGVGKGAATRGVNGARGRGRISHARSQ